MPTIISDGVRRWGMLEEEEEWSEDGCYPVLSSGLPYYERYLDFVTHA